MSSKLQRSVVDLALRTHSFGIKLPFSRYSGAFVLLLLDFLLSFCIRNTPLIFLFRHEDHATLALPFFLWSGVCHAVAASTNALVWKLGKGNCVNLITDPWVNGKIPTLRFSQSTVPQLTAPELVLPSGDWNPAVIFRHFDPQSAKEIIAMEPPHLDIDDFLYWKFTEDGSYSVKSGYRFLWFTSFGSSILTTSNSFPWSRIWKLKGSTKFPILLWRLGHNILPTAANLNSRGMAISSTCSLCHAAPETADHLFRSCIIAQHVWKSSALGIDTQVNSSIPFSIWLSNMISFFSCQSSPSHNCLLYFSCVLLSIWLVRNAVVFQGEALEPVRICKLADYLVTSHQQFPALWSSLSPSPTMVRAYATDLNPPFCDAISATSIYVLVKKLPIQHGYSCLLSYSTTGCSYLSQLRASSSFEATTKALLTGMRNAHARECASASFVISCPKLSSVLTYFMSVPISVRNSIAKIRYFLVLYPHWSVSLATG
ncbi:uncharacterized protein LOC141613130 [Silene latifolia]|uniref:uncharacterized protein LOC141613130 n=1 Tax=Silene latifolia TaxID=37657 RepID=UPI003D787D5A